MSNVSQRKQMHYIYIPEVLGFQDNPMLREVPVRMKMKEFPVRPGESQVVPLHIPAVGDQNIHTKHLLPARQLRAQPRDADHLGCQNLFYIKSCSLITFTTILLKIKAAHAQKNCPHSILCNF